MNDEKLELYKKIAYEIIDEQKLNYLETKDIVLEFKIDVKIIYRSPADGTLKRQGTIIINMKKRLARILIYTTTAQFFEDYDGKYTMKNSRKKFTRGIGKDISKENLKDTMCHELAHLRYFRHGSNHRRYTEYLINEFDSKLMLCKPVEVCEITYENT